MVSLTAKNPFQAGSMELFNYKNWIGIGAFSIVAGVTYVLIKWVSERASKVTDPVDEMLDRLT